MAAPDVPVGFPAADHRQGREHKISANQSRGWNYLPISAENEKISPNQYKKITVE